MERPRSAQERREWLVAIALYLALAFLSFLPQSLRPDRRVAYLGDSVETVYIMAWTVHQVFREPLRLFDDNVLHPLPHALAVTNHLLLPSLLVAPVVWLTDNVVLAYNVAVLLACLLAALSARWLARRLGLGVLAAWAVGALYAFHSYQINEAPRLHILFHGFLPLALERLITYLRSGERRHVFQLAAVMLLQALSSNYQLLYGTFMIVLVTLAVAGARPRRFVPRLPLLVLAGGLAGLAYAPIALPYLRMAHQHEWVRELPPGIDLAHYVSTAPTNLLYGAVGVDVRLQQRGPHFVGFISLALAGLGIAFGRRRGDETASAVVSSRLWIPAAAALATLFVLLSLGRDITVFGRELSPGPYRLLYEHAPGFQMVRIPERLGLLAMLFVALLVGRGLELVRERGGSRLAFLVAALIPLEHVSTLPRTIDLPAGRLMPAVYSWLAAQSNAPLAELPIRGEGLVREETLEMYFSTVHWRPIIHGYTAYPPLLTRVLRRLAAEFPSDASVAALRRVGVTTVVLHHGRDYATDLLHRRAGTEAERLMRWREDVRAAGLNVYERVQEATRQGRIERLARFEGEGARLFRSTADEVFAIRSNPTPTAAPFPRGRRLLRREWRYRAKDGRPELAADDDPNTAWTVARPLRGDEFFEVQFDRPTPVSGLVVRLRRDSAFPTRFRIGARDLEGRWSDVARYDDAHVLQLVERLIQDPSRAAIGFELSARPVTGLIIHVGEYGTSFDGWRIPEIEVWTP
jgi:hypothetical protein